MIKIAISKSQADIICYSGNFNIPYDNEKQFCHRYIIQSKEEIETIIDINNYRDNSSLFIDHDNRKIIIYNDWTGREDSFEYSSINEIDRPIEIVLIEKIRHLNSAYENEYKQSTMFNKRLEEIRKLIEKEIDVDSRKVSFFQREKNKEKLNMTLGKIELSQKIQDLIERKYS